MTALEYHKQILKKLHSEVKKVPTFAQLQMYFSEAMYILEDCPEEKKLAFWASKYAKAWCEEICKKSKDKPLVEACWALYWDVLKWEAPNLLDSYAIYIERNRPAKERFYLPRRKMLIKVADIYQKLEDDELDEAFIHQPPRTGKSQMATIAMVWHMCRNMELSNLYATYKESLGGAFVDGVVEILTDPTYLHSEIFPNTKIVGTDAKSHKLDLGRKKKYTSLSGKGLESGLNGEYDANGWLLIDDILEGIQDVLSPDILNRKQTIFDNNLMSRKKAGAKVIYNGTIWSLHDIFSDRLDFIQNNPKAENIRYEILKIPALDPETDESNFDYDYGVGFDTQYYQLLRAKFEDNDDIASWLAQYQQQPIERDGAVFNPAHMNFYNGVLPNEEPVRIAAFCDVAFGGGDYVSFPVGYLYEDGSVYIHDVVFNNGDKYVTQPLVVDAIIQNEVGSARFESNNGGEGYKDDINRTLKEKNIKVNISSRYAPTGKRKEQRIWDKAPEIKEYYFRDTGCRNQEYRKFMQNLYEFTMNGKNLHEDAPDSLAGFADFINNTGVGTAKAVRNPYRRR